MVGRNDERDAVNPYEPPASLPPVRRAFVAWVTVGAMLVVYFAAGATAAWLEDIALAVTVAVCGLILTSGVALGWRLRGDAEKRVNR